MALDLTDVALFVRVCVTRNLSAAGREFGLSPAASSARMAQLETQLGARLLHRTTRQITVTQEGEAFLEQARVLLDSAEQAMASVGGGNAQVRGLLRVASSVTFGRAHIMPAIAEEQNGVEDARLVRFTHGDGSVDYRATYTAYDGQRVVPRLLITKDFLTFTSHPLVGPAAINKGVALFPRPVNGELLALVRSDGETNSIARSVDGEEWHDERPVFGPRWAWELVQSGNCGSPIETEHGWLVLTHSVGPMRVYSMGAVLLDLDDPFTVLATLEEPLLRSVGSRQNGYVPNVVYSCGGIVHEGTFWIPFGVGDNRIHVASVGVDELVGAMRRA